MTSTTLADLIRATKCRKGPASGTTKRGAYWLACEPIKMRSFGGDGIGSNRTDWRNTLQLRHYRDGSISAVVRSAGWHQNSGNSIRFTRVDSILECATIESVIVALLGCDDDGAPVYSPNYCEELTAGLSALGLPESEPAPDDANAV